MTKIPEKGIEAVRGLSAERQDMAGELLLSLAKGNPQYQLTREQLEAARPAIAEADRGEFASEKRWLKPGKNSADEAALYAARTAER